MTARVFLDTNLWIYFFTKKPYDKALAVAEVVAAHSADSSLLVSTQVFGEVYHVLTRKTLYSKQQCQAIIQDLDRAFSPSSRSTPLQFSKHLKSTIAILSLTGTVSFSQQHY